MNSIRKRLVVVPAAAGLVAMLALVLAPVTVLAHSGFRPDFDPRTGLVSAVETDEAPPSQACIDAVNELRTWRVNDHAEDISEKLAQAQPEFDPATEVAEDQTESAALKSLRDKVHAACDPQEAAEVKVTVAPAPPSDACVTAKANLKAAVATQIATEKAERANKTEGTATDKTNDKAEFASLKALWTQAAAACGFASFHGDWHGDWHADGHGEREGK
jgi:hypothetical protein